MADIRIKDLATTATTSASDDYLALDGSTNGTRKILATNVANNVTDVVFGASGPSAKSSIAARAARQGLVFDGTAGATVSVPAFGTSNFTVIAFINPVSVSNNPYILAGADSTSFSLRVLSGGTARTGLTNGTINTASTSTLTLGKFNVVAYVRSSTTGAYYFDGIAGGTTTDSSNYSTSITKISGDAGGAFILNGTASILIYNRALSAAEVVSLYEAGVPAGADYNTASNTSKLTGANSDFSSAGNWTVTGATAISGGKLNLSNGDQAYCTPGTISIPVGSKFKVTITVDSITAGSVQVYTGATVGWVNIATAPGTFTQEFTFYAVSGPLTTLNLKSTGGNAVVDTVLYYQIGLLLAPDAAQSGGGLTWYDTSGNAANITLPATGVTWNVPTSGRGIFADGTAAVPSLSFSADSDTGFYRPASGEIAFTSNGNATFRMVSTGVASFLTNVTSQGTYLSLANSGAVAVGAGGTNQNITLTPSGTGVVQISNGSNSKILSFYNSSSGGGARIQLADDSSTIDGLTFLKSSGACVVTFGTASKFLIGTTLDSGALLQVGTNTTTSAGGMVFGTDLNLFRSAAGVLRISSTSNYSTEITNSGGTGAASVSFNNTGGSFYVGSDNSSGSALGGGTAYAGIIATGTAVPLIFRTNSITALTLDASQNATFAGKVLTASGTAAAPTLTFSGDSDTGIYNPAGNQLSAACSGSQIWNTTTNGLSMAAGKDIYLGNAYVAGAPTATGYVMIKDSAGATYKVLVST